MTELILRLDPALRQALDDLADARGLMPEEIAEEAVRKHLHAEGMLVRSLAERIAKEHAELLRRLGE
jgi:predicted transcriptional regulator